MSRNSNSPAVAGGPVVSSPTGQTVLPVGAGDNSSQPDPSGGQGDPSKKGLALDSAQPTSFPAASFHAGATASADPTIQAAVQGTNGQLAPSGASAHKSDLSDQAGRGDSPASRPAPPEFPAGTGPVQVAEMANKAAQSEMRIGLSTSAFGNVEVHTVVHANEVGVAIGSEKGDLRSLLSSELPGIAHSLQQQSLRLSEVNFHQAGFGFSNQMSSGSDSQPRSFASRSAAVPSPEMPSGEEPDLTEASSTASSGGLSILA